MPIIVSPIPSSGVGVGPIRFGGLPDFNGADPAFVVSTFEGWFSRAAPAPVLVAAGGGAGAVAAGLWEPAEAYYTLAGSIECGSAAGVSMFRDWIVRALPPHVESSVEVADAHGGDRQVFVRLYDRPEVTPVNNVLSFSLPLVAPDPFKYALQPLAGDVGAFVSQEWFRTYTDSAGVWVREYDLLGSTWVRRYTQAVPDGPYPSSLTLSSPGDTTSRRVTITVSGPLTAGDWRVVNESTGEELWVDLSVLDGQQLVLDSAARTARLNGEDVDHLVFGDFLSLAPGDNLFRLATGSASDAHASVSALPAYL